MAVLNLTKLWINRLDTGDAVSAYTAEGRPQSHEEDGTVETFGAGRRRSIMVEGEQGQFGFVLRQVSLSTLDTLRSWKGLAVQVRDHRGQRFFGVFFVVTPVEYHNPGLYDAAITLHMITHSEEV